MKYIHFIEKNINGYLIIYGEIGKRTYIYYTKKRAITQYNKECKEQFKKC